MPLIALFIIAIMSLSAVPAFAIAEQDGQEIDITSEEYEAPSPAPKKAKLLAKGSGSGDISGNQSFSVDTSHNSTAGFVVFSVGGYEGSCIQKGVSYELSGTANMKEKDNTDLLAKAAYYVDVKKGWFKNTTDRPSIMDQTGVASRFKAGLLAEDILQCANQGVETWSERAASQTYPQGYIDYVVDIVENTLPSVTVPSSFIIWKGNPSDGSQDFAVWGDRPTGKLKLKKASANTGITG